MLRSIILIISSFIFIHAQSKSQPSSEYDSYQLSSERYFSNSDGQIMMKVNVWGHVKFPGGHLVYDGIDLASLVSIVGGLKTGANLKKLDYTEKFPIGVEKLFMK